MGASKNFWWLGFDSQGGLLTTHVDDNAAKLLYATNIKYLTGQNLWDKVSEIWLDIKTFVQRKMLALDFLHNTIKFLSVGGGPYIRETNIRRAFCVRICLFRLLIFLLYQ